MKHIKNTLYILTPDTYLHLQNENIIVRVGGEERVRVPAIGIEAIYCFGNIAVSTPLIAFCGERGISLCFFSEYGKFYGRVEGPIHGNILLRRKQFALLEDDRERLRIVRSIMLGKLSSEKIFLQRMRREHRQGENEFSTVIDRITAIAVAVRESDSIDSMRGLEGAAASAYYSVFPCMLINDRLAFNGRSRRPPEDPANAVLSFLYTLLKNDIQSALEGVGLDPAAGFLHTLRSGRPALALDLMEELRAPLCDRMAVSLINLGKINEKHFTQLTAPVYLNEDGRKIVISTWQQRKKETIRHTFCDETIPIGLIPHTQALLFARTIRGDLDEYAPFFWR